jgi:hypothetical protein
MNPFISKVFNDSLSYSLLILVAKLKPVLLKVVNSWRIKESSPFCFKGFLTVLIISNNVLVILLHTLIDMLYAQYCWNTREHLLYCVYCSIICVYNYHPRVNTIFLKLTKGSNNVSFILAREKAYPNCITLARACYT